jgi:serine/threonine protein kinase
MKYLPDLIYAKSSRGSYTCVKGGLSTATSKSPTFFSIMEFVKSLILDLPSIPTSNCLIYFYSQNFYDLDIGSPLYMSPEGMIDHMYGMKTDVWAFGVIIFELLHGKTPFSYCSS